MFLEIRRLSPFPLIHSLLFLTIYSGLRFDENISKHIYGRIELLSEPHTKFTDALEHWISSIVQTWSLRLSGAQSSFSLQLDDVIGQANSVSSNLAQQRGLFENIGSKIVNVSSKFPAVNSVMNAIKRKKNKVCIHLFRLSSRELIDDLQDFIVFVHYCVLTCILDYAFPKLY